MAGREPQPSALAGHLVALGLPPSMADAVASLARPARHDAGAAIERRGAPAQAVWFLAEGVVSHQVRLSHGASAVVSLYGAGTLFNHQHALFDAPNAVDTMAVTAVASLALDVPSYRALIEREPTFLRAMLRLTAHRATRLAEALAVFKQGSPVCRIAFVLAHCAEAFDPECGFSWNEPAHAAGITLPASLAALASMANVSRSTLAEVLRELTRAGFVGRAARGALRIEQRAAWLALLRRKQAEPALAPRASAAELVAALRGA